MDNKSQVFTENECEQHEGELLNHYFSALEINLIKRSLSINIQGVIEEYKSLYKYAWADFYRFLDGWSPGHWKIHDYSKAMTNQVLKELQIRSK